MSHHDTLNALHGKHILLGISGGIAAYKLPLLVRLLKKAGADVQVVLTQRAKEFVTPAVLETLSQRKVLCDIFPTHDAKQDWTEHIRLGEWADMFVVAPATAHTLAKLAHGLSDDMLSVLFLALRPERPRLIFPSMDGEMLSAPAVQRNLALLRQDGCIIIEPEYGELASGLIGKGRLPEPETLFKHITEVFATSASKWLAGKCIVVTAGATRERLDPVRFISNFSTGKMGFALAEAAAEWGAKTILITGKTPLPTPPNVERIDVESAEEMLAAAHAYFERCDVFIAAAAVADYRPEHIAPQKLKKDSDRLVLTLVKNPDILLEFGQQKRAHQIAIGFALETSHALENARAKLEKKNLDWIALNCANDPNAGFEVDTNRLTLLSRTGEQHALPLMSKKEAARALLKLTLSKFRTDSA
ncbi:MAG: bifunctional phosphopantothenoylcysteine decarboxylase/phosphopantothenate--cysteine ligase CoaBC [Chloroherpetonaceae bacterium]|nr:bifunctional phosphopantothenoylcysteine decarboxylase/phosphopantothenate--cysteine ligase CoaBC [Chloroherpetonaceae bacterium]MDW8019236.1 bifunctional phosphopantothenoylcysteine decarboxylase/phosphopantothenate--cysteine ligase CoaBC [Chloroherpetonaceae bacterium]